METFNTLKAKQEKFLQLKVVEQMKYADIEKKMGVNRAQLTEWWRELKDYREPLIEIRNIWKKKCPQLDFWEFHNWFTKTKRKCHYCGIDEQQITKLISRGKIKTKRLKTRGKKLEIERLKPNESYDVLSNLVYSCYWCNNAKTDEFSEKEFEPIGKCIGSIWKTWLNSQ